MTFQLLSSFFYRCSRFFPYQAVRPAGIDHIHTVDGSMVATIKRFDYFDGSVACEVPARILSIFAWKSCRCDLHKAQLYIVVRVIVFNFVRNARIMRWGIPLSLRSAARGSRFRGFAHSYLPVEDCQEY